MPGLQAHVIQDGREGHAICGDLCERSEGVTRNVASLPFEIGLQLGEAQVKITSSQLEWQGRTVVLFRVVGDDSFGWVEAAVLLEGTVELVTHRLQPNHSSCAQFGLPKSVSVIEA